MGRHRGRSAGTPPVRGPLTVFRNGGVANNDEVDAAIRDGAAQAGYASVVLLEMHDLDLPQDADDADWIHAFCQTLAAGQALPQDDSDAGRRVLRTSLRSGND